LNKASTLVQGLRAAGRPDSDGEFSLDPAKAREKLRQFQLAEPHRYVLFLVEAAVLRGATKIEFFIDTDDMRMVFDGLPFGVDDLARIFVSLFAKRVADRERQALRALAFGVNAAMALRPRFVRVSSGAPGKASCLEVRPGKSEQLFAIDKHPGHTRIHVKSRLSMTLASEFIWSLGNAKTETVLLEGNCRWADTPIYVNDKLVSQQNYVPHDSQGRLVLDELGLRGVAGLIPGAAEASLCFLSNGVSISELNPAGLPPGFKAVVEAEDLSKDLSGGGFIHDDAFDRVMARLGAIAHRLSARSVAAGRQQEMDAKLVEPVLDPASVWVSRKIDAPGIIGEVGISKGKKKSRFQILVDTPQGSPTQHRILLTLTNDRPIPQLNAVLYADFKPTENFGDLVRDKTLAFALLELMRELEALVIKYAQLGFAMSGLDNDFFLAWLERSLAADYCVSSLRALGFRGVDADKYISEFSASDDFTRPRLGLGKLSGSKKHPVARLPLFGATKAGVSVSLADISKQIDKNGWVAYVDPAVFPTKSEAYPEFALHPRRSELKIVEAIFGRDSLRNKTDAYRSFIAARRHHSRPPEQLQIKYSTLVTYAFVDDDIKGVLGFRVPGSSPVPPKSRDGQAFVRILKERRHLCNESVSVPFGHVIAVINWDQLTPDQQWSHPSKASKERIHELIQRQFAGLIPALSLVWSASMSLALSRDRKRHVEALLIRAYMYFRGAMLGIKAEESHWQQRPSRRHGPDHAVKALLELPFFRSVDGNGLSLLAILRELRLRGATSNQVAIPYVSEAFALRMGKLPKTERMVLLVSKSQETLLRQLLGDHRIARWQDKLRAQHNEERLAAVPTLPHIALEPGEALVKVPLVAEGLVGEVGLSRYHPARQSTWQVRLCKNARLVEEVTLRRDYSLRAIIDDTGFKLYPSGLRVQRDPRFDKGMRQIQSKAPELMELLVTGWTSLAELPTTRVSAYRHVLDHLANLGPNNHGQYLSTPTLQRFADIPGLAGIDGRMYSVRDLSLCMAKYGAVFVLTRSFESDREVENIYLDDLIILYVADYEARCLERVFPSVLNLDATWEQVRIKLEAFAKAFPLPTIDKVSKRASIEVHTGTMQGILYLPTTDHARSDLQVAFGRMGLQLARLSISEQHPCAGIIELRDRAPSVPDSQVHLEPEQVHYLQQRARDLYRDSSKPLSPVPPADPPLPASQIRSPALTKEARLLRAMRSSLAMLKKQGSAPLPDAVLDKIDINALGATPLVRATSPGLVINSEHPVTRWALDHVDSDPIALSFITAALYTSLNADYAQITDRHERQFIQGLVHSTGQAIEDQI